MKVNIFVNKKGIRDLFSLCFGFKLSLKKVQHFDFIRNQFSGKSYDSIIASGCEADSGCDDFLVT